MKRKWGEPIPTPNLETGPETTVVNQETHDTDSIPATTTTVKQGMVKQAMVKQEVKKPKVTSGGNGLLALGEYESDSDDQIEEDLGDAGEMDEDAEVEVEVTEEDIQLMRVLGAAAAADME